MKKTKAAIILLVLIFCIIGQAADIYEPDSVNDMPIIETDGTPMYRAIDSVGDVDYVRFVLAEPATVEIETHSSDSSADTKIWLYNSANHQIEINDDKSDYSLLSKITRTLVADTYRIEIRQYDNSKIIPEYSITVTNIGLQFYIGGADFVYGGSSNPFTALMNAHGNEIMTVDWSSDSPLATFTQDTLETDYPSADTDITITASYEQAQEQKQVRLRSGAKPAGEVNYYAVIVGIADYPGTINDLSYTVKDATAIRNELIRDPAWKNENITLLLDSQATPTAIQSAISDMGQSANSGDVCLFYYSGHGGSQAIGEYLYVYSGYVFDYDFAAWINTLPTDNYIILLDACHSGGQIYSLDTGYFNPSYSSTRSSFAANIAQALGISNLDENGRGVVLASSAADELSWEDPSLGHGEFTYYLLEAMSGAADFDGDGFVSVQEGYLYIDGIGLDSQQVQIYDGNRLSSPILQYNSDIYTSSIEIEGEGLIPAEQLVSFVCKANYSNGTQTDITDLVEWDITDIEAVVYFDGTVYASNSLAGSTFTITATYNHIHLASLDINVLAADFNGDGIVDEADLMVLASQWLQEGSLSADIYPFGGDGVVNLLDYVEFGNWFGVSLE